ncbi:MAG: NifU family protein [Alphaproteobacteria bacterium]|nr:NifU family protein [Alphaproteobacteria bacterium]
MFIQTEQTPNPATLKFLPGREVLGDATAHFASVDQADRSPLAKSLFEADGVAAVFLGSDFITITAEDGADWQDLKPAILGIIMEHFTAGLPVMEGEAKPQAGTADAGEDSELVTQIKDLLETRVRPAVAQDGGDIIFDRFDSGVVYLQMQGACSGCPSSTATLKHGIENLLRHFIPEVEEVRPV